MFRLKDHIISLAAVFLALGLGILIGSGMGDDMLIKQQRLIIEQMSRDFRSLREERLQLEARVQRLTRDISLWEKYQEALYPAMVSGALDGRKTAVVTHGAQVPAGLARVLQDAGVAVTGVLTVEGRQHWEGPAAVLGEAVAALAGGGKPDARGKEAVEAMLLSGGLNLECREAVPPDAVIVLVGERKAVSEELVKAMCQRLAGDGLPVVALEDSHIKDSFLGVFRELGIPTIDNADTVFGQITLLAVLNGQSGHFGVKQGAEQFVAPVWGLKSAAAGGERQ